MPWQEIIYVLTPFVLAVIVTAALALYILIWYRHAPGGKTLALSMLVMTVWALTDMLEMTSADLGIKLLWTKCRYAAIPAVATTWFFYVLYYTGQEGKWLIRHSLALASAALLANAFLIFSNQTHGLVWRQATINVDAPLSTLDITYGPGMLLTAVCGAAATLMATLALVRARFHARHLYRRQINGLLLTTYLPWLGIALDLLGWKPYPQFYPIPWALTLSSLIGTWNVIGLRVGDLMPVAREVVIDGIDDSVIVLDSQNRVVDLNPAAQRLIGHSAKAAVGRPIEEIWADWPALIEHHGEETQAREGVTLGREGQRRAYDVRAFPLASEQGQLPSQAIVLRDINELKSASEALRKAHDELELRVQERTAELEQANEALEVEITGHKQAREELADRARELARSNALITALSQVAAQVEAVATPNQVMQILGGELRHLGITCMIALLEPDAQALVINYSSMGSRLMALGEKMLGLSMYGYRMPPQAFPIWDELIEQKRAVFVPQALSLISASMPGIPWPMLERMIQLGGDPPNMSVIWLPLVTRTGVIGAMGVWGTDLWESDLPVLSVFASQVAAALEVARLYEAERQRTTELSRARGQLEEELVERQRTEKQLAASLREKTVLLQEVHHRVKNNLQIVSSLLSLQSQRIADEGVLAAFRESRDRIGSIAMIHEKLYQSTDLAQLDFASYVRDLTGYLLRSYGVSSKGVRLDVDVTDLSLDLDTAIPCGLIINELVSNTLKHAFPDRDRDGDGRVRVVMREDEGKITLVVSDNGVGLPEDLDAQHTESLGLQLVNILTDQLDGTLALDRKAGTTFEITFDKPSHAGGQAVR
jgi:PAS domain S-box-containing protein